MPSRDRAQQRRRAVEGGAGRLLRRHAREITSALRTNRLIAVLAAGLVLGGLALRLSIAWQDVEVLPLKVVADDGYYYLLTAERISNGQNISFDGLTLSNGYHPLWLFFLAPLYLVPGRSLPLHLALTASSIFDVAAAGLVALAAGKLTGNRGAALFALTFYLFIPQNVFASVNGVESALAAMLLGALLLTLVSRWRERQDNWARWSVATGVLGGLTVLARLESALVLAAVLALIALFQSGATRWRAPLSAGAVAGAIVAPWFIWSFVALGTVVPVSAESMTWALREYLSASHPDWEIADHVGQGLSYTKTTLLTRLPGLYFPPRPFAALFLSGVTLVGAHFLIFSRGWLRRKTAGELLTVGLPFAAFAAMFLFNSAYRWLVRDWYFAWGMPIVALLAAVAFAYVDRLAASITLPIRGRRQAIEKGARQPLLYGILVALFVLAYVGPARDTWRAGRYPEQEDRLEAAAYIRSNTGPEARVASFNAGVMGYYSDRTVINLDGVVNPDALSALRNYRLVEYLRSVDVTYVADRDKAWRDIAAYIRPDDWSQSVWGEDPGEAFVSLARFGPDSYFGQMRVWRLTD